MKVNLSLLIPGIMMIISAFVIAIIISSYSTYYVYRPCIVDNNVKILNGDCVKLGLFNNDLKDGIFMDGFRLLELLNYLIFTFVLFGFLFIILSFCFIEKEKEKLK
jgi:hypothetical protein